MPLDKGPIEQSDPFSKGAGSCPIPSPLSALLESPGSPTLAMMLSFTHRWLEGYRKAGLAV